jgi:hypothetical protein
MMAQTLLLCADEALYRAKREGGSRLCHSPAEEWPAPGAMLPGVPAAHAVRPAKIPGL